MRRGVRNRTKPKKYGDFVAASPSKRKVQDESPISDEDEIEAEFDNQKPTGNIMNSKYSNVS